MLLSEWNMEEALEVAKEESREEIFALLDSGMSLAEVKQKFASEGAEITNLSVAEIFTDSRDGKTKQKKLAPKAGICPATKANTK
jgi:hypothetical protein